MVAEYDFLSRGAVRAVLAPPSWLSVDHSGARRSGPAVWSEHPGALAICTGPMWSNSRVEGLDPARPLGALRDRAAGIDLASQRVGEGVTLSVLSDGRAVATRGGLPEDGAAVAVQGWPSLVVAGAVSATDNGTNAERVPRAAWWLADDGRVGFAATLGLSMATFAEELRALGAIVAGYTDGGGSTYLQARAAPWRPVAAPDRRALFSWLVLARPRSVARRAAGSSAFLFGGLALLAGAALVRRSR